METQRIIRLNAILLCGVVILIVTVAFIFDKTTTIPKENENVVTASLASKPHTVEVTTPSSISYQIASGSVISATSSSISAKEKRQKEKMRKKKIKERRKKRLQKKKRAERKRMLEQRRKAQQRKLTKAKAYSYTHLELLTLAKIIWEEARGEPYIGKVAVGAVAMNRLNTKSSEFGAENGKLMEVLLKKWAFAEITISDEEFISSEYYEDCVKAALAAFAGEDPTKEYFENGALFFYDVTIDISPRQMKYREGIDTYCIGNHAFHITLND